MIRKLEFEVKYIFIIIQQEVISVCLFVCMSEYNSVPKILIGELSRTTGMFLAWFENVKMNRLT